MKIKSSYYWECETCGHTTPRSTKTPKAEMPKCLQCQGEYQPKMIKVSEPGKKSE
jgi:NAD-dependent SIR2 family protein deacetylase